jgi:peroxiredoxin
MTNQTTERSSERRRIHDLVGPLRLDTLSHGTIHLPSSDSAFVHLQFRRFAGCPVCNLHMRAFAQSQDALRSAGVTTVAFFHSTADQMRPYQGDLPFAAVADPERYWYRHFGVERSALAVAHPRVMWSALRGLALAPSNPFVGGLDQTGLPADFLLDRSGSIVDLHYGAHADDQWSVDELLRLTQRVAIAPPRSG